MGDVRLEINAYAKMILHAAKYPHCAVNGLLIAENKGRGNKDDIVLVDAVPLFHHSHNLAPMAEVALTKVDLVSQANRRMIVGYYAGCENFYDNTPDKCPSPRIAEKVAEQFPNAVFLVIDNATCLVELRKPEKEASVKGYRFNDNKWKAIDSEKIVLVNPNTQLIMSCLMDQDIHKAMLRQGGKNSQLVDFDNYLDDITQDWTNAGVDAQIKDIQKDIVNNSNKLEDESESNEDDKSESSE